MSQLETTSAIEMSPCSSKDARLPIQLQRAMAAEAEAAREARAKVRGYDQPSHAESSCMNYLI